MQDASAAGALKRAFSGVAFKMLTAVETDPRRSNQHEFNGSRALRSLFGLETPQRIATEFVWMPESGDFVREAGLLTWYDARERHPTRSEYRLYYVGNSVTARAREGDFLVIARQRGGATLVLLAPGGGSAAARIALMFGIETRPGAAFAALTVPPDDPVRQALPGHGSPDGGWAGEQAVHQLKSDLSIRASIMEMQREIGQSRRPDGSTDEWLPDT